MDIKNLLTTIGAWVTGVAGGLVALVLAGTIILPIWVVTLCVVLVLVANVTTQVLTGKNANGTVKTEIQVAEQTKEQEKTLGKAPK